MRVEQPTVAKAHGWYNIVTGIWPLLSMRTFEQATGPKVDTWLVRTVGALLVSNGVALIAAGRSPDGLKVARLVGQGTAASLGVVDLIYASKGRISKIYLLDAAVEAAWVITWATSKRPSTP